jgi:hypothetical protein
MALDYYKGTIPILDDNPANEAAVMALAFPGAKGQWGHRDVGFGAIPRDYGITPQQTFGSPPSNIKLYDPSEYDALYDEEEATLSSLEHLYLRGGKPAFVNLDQNGHPDCWAFSTGQAIMFDRLKQGIEPHRLNPHATAVILNQLNGGWCGLSAQSGRELGYAEEGTGEGQWPGHSRSRSYDTPALRASMAKYKVQEEWVDLTKQVYNQNLTNAMLATCHFLKIPTPTDYAWWGHSVVSIRHVRIEKGRWGRLILNSWANWGRFGLSVIEGSKLNTMGALAIRMTKAA